MTQPNLIPTPRDPDLVSAETVLKRAARLVREQAIRTGTALTYVQNGRLKIKHMSDERDPVSTMDAGR